MACASLTISTGSLAKDADGYNTLNDTNESADSDGTSLSDYESEATDDAQSFFATHNSEKWKSKALDIGLAHAIKKGYKGNEAYAYMSVFNDVFEALFMDQ
jgi:hypothetical protein